MLSRRVFSSRYSRNFLRRPYHSLTSNDARLKKETLTNNSGGRSQELWSVACARQDRMLWKGFPIRLYSQNEKENSIPIADRIQNILKNNKVVIFMKGVPDQPMCGFSNAVVQVLQMHGVADYDAHNVLADEELRQGIKDYSDWPTIPQVYFDGEFIGGCDILLQMHQSGELIDELKKLGIKSALLK